MAKNKLKTNKTLLKRTRVTKRGKIVKKQVGMGHLKVKKTSPNKTRKSKRSVQENKGHRSMFKKLLAKAGKRI